MGMMDDQGEMGGMSSGGDILAGSDSRWHTTRQTWPFSDRPKHDTSLEQSVTMSPNRTHYGRHWAKESCEGRMAALVLLSCNPESCE